MPLLRLDNLSLQFGSRDLLKDVDFTLRKGDKVGLLGRNGEGKTTLLKIIAGQIQPDGGERWLRSGTVIAWLEQSLLAASNQSVYEVVASGLHETGQLINAYHQVINAADMTAMARIQEQLDASDGWQLQQKVETTISQLQLPADAAMESLSGGWRKRVALAQALVSEPDILLLDEPTNHLDIPTIEWLEKTLQQYRGALVLVTHDRAFLQKVTNQIAELDRGSLYVWQGNYHGFLNYRAERQHAEEKANALFDKRLAQEEVWIRQGIKARRTRNEGRVRALESMREQFAQRTNKQGKAGFKIESATTSGKLVAEIENVSHSFDDKNIITNFSTRIMRGDRIGIIGPNGAGKSTLLKIILGELTPQQGKVTLGTKLEIAYFDQLRNQLDDSKNLIENVCGGQDFIEINGKNRHAISYLSDFLFSPERVRQPVATLSGGEQNRAILAKLFSKPANILVLDEPTNDLDIETLELLEELLLNFDGTLLLVSHDREFMDNTVTRILAVEGNGQISESVGGYSDWLHQGGSLSDVISESALNNNNGGTETRQVQSQSDNKADNAPTASSKGKPRLSYHLQRELDKLPSKIEALENQQQELEVRIADPDFYKSEPDLVKTTLAELSDTQNSLETYYQRWEELEAG